MLKNILTFGGAGKLKKELETFENLQHNFISASQQYSLLIESRSILFYNLMIERNEAIRNFELLKSLIRIKKELKSKKTESNIDSLSIDVGVNFNNLIKIENSDFTEIIDSSIRNISKSTGQSFDRIVDSFNNKGVVSKQELKAEALMIGVDLVGEAFNYIGNLNEEVNRKRKEVQHHIDILQNRLQQIYDSYENLFADSLRIDEIFQSLNKNNKIFVEKYKLIIEKYFVGYDLNNKNEHLHNYNDNLEQDIKFLIMFCNEYSKTIKINITSQHNISN